MPYVIPVFIPHQGCPRQCLFCNQHSITGENAASPAAPQQVKTTIEDWLARPHRAVEVQVAFYGGSFTCLPFMQQEALLGAVQPFLQSGRVQAIRLSTRPDCVDREVCVFLRERGVQVVELGVQSLDDTVLREARRGHSAADSIVAARLLNEAGMELGVQLMPGLPLENTRSFLATVRGVIALAPVFVRLYPALVIEHAELAARYRQGEYRPLSMNRAIALCALVWTLFDSAGIRVVRMGLQPSAALERELVAGPYHPAFGELVQSRLWFRRLRRALAACPADRMLRVRICPRDLSAVVGMKRMNMERLARLGLASRLELVTDMNIQRGMWEYAVD